MTFDGKIYCRLEIEEPIECDGVAYFFSSSLDDLDPFIGFDGETWPGWGDDRIKTSQLKESSRLFWPRTMLEAPDRLVLWPTVFEMIRAHVDFFGEAPAPRVRQMYEDLVDEPVKGPALMPAREKLFYHSVIRD